MFGKISLGNFKSQTEVVSLKLDFVDGGVSLDPDADSEPIPLHTTTLTWSVGEPTDQVLSRLHAELEAPALWRELACLTLIPAVPGPGRTTSSPVRAAGYACDHVRARLSIQRDKLVLHALEVSGAGAGSDGATLGAALRALPLDVLGSLTWRCAGAGALWSDPALLDALRGGLTRMDLRGAGLGVLPAAVGTLRALRHLDLTANGLKILPPALGSLAELRTLRADGNDISLIPGELARCARLRVLSLEGNRLAHVPLNFAALRQLRDLDLLGNPLEVLPEIGPCTSLVKLAVANLRVSCSEDGSELHVELLPLSGQGYGLWGESRRAADRLRPIFELMLRRSTGHHPLLSGALRHLAASDPKHRTQMVGQEGALQQLVLMALSDSEQVARDSCRTLALIASHSPELAEAVAARDVSPVLGLLRSLASPAVTVAALRVLAALALTSAAAGARAATPEVLDALAALCTARDTPRDVLAAALEAVGNLCFADGPRAALRARGTVMAAVDALAAPGDDGGQDPVRAAAVRVLAILGAQPLGLGVGGGENAVVQRAVGRLPMQGRGVRILSMDGGGMKGLATVRMLRELEARTGRRVHELFDLVVGTSTGGLLAAALALRRFTLDDCEAIYKVLGQRVFSRAAPKDKEEGWVDSFYRSFHTRTQHVRAVVVGYKHDSAMYEELLKEYCDLSSHPEVLGKSMIGKMRGDSAPLNCPRVALVATLASVTPALPFVFRNYEFAPEDQKRVLELEACTGSSRHAVWQAARASSAATYYLDGFECGADRFQDGAVTSNNPAMVALQEAQLLWPGAPLEVLVSIGTGGVPTAQRPGAVSSYMETGSILIESATDTERVAAALAATAHLIPGLQYFRFAPLDVRCQMALDEIRPEEWAKLEAATEDCIVQSADALDAAAAALMKGMDGAGTPTAPGDTSAQHLRLPPCARLVKLRCAALGQAGAGPSAAAPSPPMLVLDTAGLLEASKPNGAAAGVGSRAGPRGSSAAGEPRAADEIEAPRPEAYSGSEEEGSPGPGAADRDVHAAQPAAQGGLTDYFTSWFSPTKGPSADAAAGKSRKRVRRADAAGPPRDAGPSAADVLAAALEAELPGGGSSAVVLDLPRNYAGDLVLCWKSEVHAVVGSSSGEREWEARLGGAMPSIFASTSSVTLPGGGEVVELLSQHTQWVQGQAVDLRMLQHTFPGAVLTPGEVTEGALQDGLVGSLVFLPAATSATWVRALLVGARCRAVVSPAQLAPGLALDLTPVWPLLLAGQPLPAVLQRHAHLGLQVHTLDAEGKVVAVL